MQSNLNLYTEASGNLDLYWTLFSALTLGNQNYFCLRLAVTRGNLDPYLAL